jgi:hypothetical protein
MEGLMHAKRTASITHGADVGGRLWLLVAPYQKTVNQMFVSELCQDPAHDTDVASNNITGLKQLAYNTTTGL